MKAIITGSLILIGALNLCFAQKKIIDQSAIDNWPMLNNYAISNSGKYLYYSYRSSKTVGQTTVNTDTLVISQIDNKQQISIANADDAVFTSDSKFLFSLQNHNTLCKVTLQSYKIEQIKHVTSFNLKEHNNVKWLGYLTKGLDSTFVLENLVERQQYKFIKVKEYAFSENGNVLFIHTIEGVVRIQLETLSKKVICKCSNISMLSVDETGSKVAFINLSSNINELRYFSSEMDSSKIILTDADFKLLGYKLINQKLQFSANGDHLLTKIEKDLDVITRDIHPTASPITVWSYKDDILQSQQKNRLSEILKSYLTVINLRNYKYSILESDTKTVISSYKISRYILLEKFINQDESYWKNDTSELSIFSLSNYKTNSIPNCKNNKRILAQLSPKENFILWFDIEKKDWFSYEINTSKIKNITENIHAFITENIPGHIIDFVASEIEWLDGDRALILRDRFDLWRVDPVGKKDPINLTNGFGRKLNVTFYNLGLKLIDQNKISTQLIGAFDNNSMNNGFWSANFCEPLNPKKLTMGPHLYFYPKNGNFLPQKAKFREIYLVRRSGSTEAPNLYLTSDFKLFTNITNIEPHSCYNWLTAELIKWKLPDGNFTKGILYKPEDFNPNKKYPLIFTYYEQRSDELNFYYKPDTQLGRIDIPWFVNRGYLILVADMFFYKGYNGRGIVNTITSAVEFLKHFAWFDVSKIGIQGHSFGGYETNYLVTHTNIFAAAQEMAGQSDLLSGYGSLTASAGTSRQSLYEQSQGNIPCPPWYCPELYLENTPLFDVGTVETPLLMVHNQNDFAVPYSQAIEFFTALKRAKKEVWLLEYNNEGHANTNSNNKLDLTIRTEQFFNHYLKDSSLPGWMVHNTNKYNVSSESQKLNHTNTHAYYFNDDSSVLKELIISTSNKNKVEDLSNLLDNYLEAIKDPFLIENINFLLKYVTNTESKTFTFLLKNNAKIDNILVNAIASKRIQEIIYKEKVKPLLDETPDFNAVQSILKQYPEVDCEYIIGLSVVRYLSELLPQNADKASLNSVKNTIRFATIYDDRFHDGAYNDWAWLLFQKATGRKDLKKALKWSKKQLDRSNPNSDEYGMYLDTYANLLYKLGQTNKAISAEEKAVKIRPNDREISETLLKMRKGQKTWD
jgi:tetratricopeptide (TPR) repeat protein